MEVVEEKGRIFGERFSWKECLAEGRHSAIRIWPHGVEPDFLRLRWHCEVLSAIRPGQEPPRRRHSQKWSALVPLRGNLPLKDRVPEWFNFELSDKHDGDEFIDYGWEISEVGHNEFSDIEVACYIWKAEKAPKRLDEIAFELHGKEELNSWVMLIPPQCSSDVIGRLQNFNPDLVSRLILKDVSKGAVCAFFVSNTLSHKMGL